MSAQNRTEGPCAAPESTFDPPKGIDRQVWQDALYRFWCRELEALDDRGRPAWQKRRTAAVALCKLVGIASLVEALGTDVARLPPQWPEVDIVPMGGGPGYVRCSVRTIAKGRKWSVGIGIAVNAQARRREPKVGQDQIAEAVERGRFELRALIEGRKTQER